MTSLFDPKSFFSAPLGGTLATKSIPAPIGETVGQIKAFDIASGEKDGKAWYMLKTEFTLSDPEYISKWGVPDATEVTVKMDSFLDVSPGGGIAMGPNKNVRLGQLLEAAGVNQAGKTMDMAVGQMVRVTVIHEPDSKDPSIVYARVNKVARY